jgi:hypothetical protein
MGKLDVSRRDGERLDAYVGRLERLARRPGLAAEDRAALAVSLEAARALLRQHQAPKPTRPSDHGHAYRPPSDPGEAAPPLFEYCKALCRSLSPEKRARLLRWLQDDMPD